MIRPLFALSVLALAFPAEAFAGSYLRVESWNMRHEGWSGETDYLGDAEQIWFEFGSSSTSAAGYFIYLPSDAAINKGEYDDTTFALELWEDADEAFDTEGLPTYP